jgi:hypothetical protein
MGGGKNSAPKPPNYGPIAEASKEAAQYSYALGREQLEWAREQDFYNRQIADAVIGSSLDRQYITDQNAMADRARYEQIYQPLEDTQTAEALSYASPARREYEMGRASSEVAQQMEGARRSARQQLESFGIDPSATRYAALDLGSRVQGAAAQAGAANQAGAQTEAIGRALRSESINVGRGYPGQIAGTYGTALQSGNQAVNSSLATTASGANTMGTAPQWQGLGNQSTGIWGNTLNMGYQNQLAQYQANQQASSGIGSILGGALGVATMFLEDGGEVPDEAITSGGNLPTAISPSRGAAIDDIRARVNQTGQEVRLNADEFIVPQDVAKWKGEEFFQKLIEQSRKAKNVAPAKPSMTPPAQPASALPVR